MLRRIFASRLERLAVPHVQIGASRVLFGTFIKGSSTKGRWLRLSSNGTSCEIGGLSLKDINHKSSKFAKIPRLSLNP